MILKNKTAIITGASDGLGKEVALALSKENVKLALVGRDKKRLEKVKATALKNGSPKVETYLCDIRKTKEISKVINQIKVDFKTINILVNCAGIWQKLKPASEINEEVVDEVITTNLTGLIHFTRLTIHHLKESGEAAIINVSSRSGFKAQEGQSVYTASKFGVSGYTEVLKEELKNSNIRVACVYQGGTNTDMFKKVGEKIPEESYKKFIPPENLAKVILFMLSQPKNTWLHDVRVEY